jgi:hypothetical protein
VEPDGEMGQDTLLSRGNMLVADVLRVRVRVEVELRGRLCSRVYWR